MNQLNKYYNNLPLIILGYELKENELEIFLKNISERDITKIKIKYLDEIYEIDNLTNNKNNDFTITIKRKRNNVVGEIDIFSIITDGKEIYPQGKSQMIVRGRSINFLGREKYLFVKDVLKENNISRKDIKYIPHNGDMYWNCLCGETNFNTHKCNNCGMDKEKVLSVKTDYAEESYETSELLKIRLNTILWLVIIYVFYIIIHMLLGDFLLDNNLKNNMYGIINRFIAPLTLIIVSILSFIFLNRYKTRESKVCEVIKLITILYLNVASMIKTLETAYNGLFQIGMDILFVYELIRLHLLFGNKYRFKKVILALSVICGLISFGKMINYSKYDLELSESGLEMTIKTKGKELNIPDKLDGIPITSIIFLEDYDYKIETIHINKYLENINIKSNLVLPNLKTITTNKSEKMHVDNGILYLYNGKILLIPHNVTSITLEKEVIDRYSAMYALGLETIYIKNTVKTIEIQAFEGCKNVKEIIFEEGSNLEMIEDNVFKGCEALEEFELPISVKKLGNGVLAGCNNVKKVKVPFVGNQREDNPKDLLATDIFVRLFGGTAAIQDYLVPETLENVEIYDIELIHNATFYRCKNIKEIILPKKMTYIGVNAFYGCKSLSSFTIPEGIETISESTFEGCKNLKEIVIPSSVKVIDTNAFKSCESLEKVIYNGDIKSLEIRDGNDIIKNILFLKGV